MRFRAITLSSLLVLSFIWTNSASGQTTEDEIASMKGEIAAMKVTMERILAGRRAVDRLLADAVVLTDQDCAVLGADWKRYEGMSGRFPLGAGRTKDVRGEERTFTIGDGGGAYSHQLTVAEMPSHKHPLHLNQRRRGREPGSDDVRKRHRLDLAKDTGSMGGNQPHNNIPPYLVLNFCHKEAGSRD